MTSSGDGEESPVCDGFGVRAALVSLGRRMAVAGRRCTGGLSDRVARLRAAVEDRQVDPEDGGRCRAVAARVVAAARPAAARCRRLVGGRLAEACRPPRLRESLGSREFLGSRESRELLGSRESLRSWESRESSGSREFMGFRKSREFPGVPGVAGVVEGGARRVRRNVLRRRRRMWCGDREGALLGDAAAAAGSCRPHGARLRYTLH